MKYTISGRTFPSKESVHAEVSRLLNVPLGTEYDEDNDWDFAFLYDLAKFHPDYEEKQLARMVRATVRTGMVREHTFILTLDDGSEIDLGTGKCIKNLNGRAPSAMHYFQEACEHSIINEKLRYKNDYFHRTKHPVCEWSGEEITFNESDVHHDGLPMKTITNNFVAETGIDITNVKYKKDVFGDKVVFGKWFEDHALADKFREYHRAHAKFMVVKREYHTAYGLRKSDQKKLDAWG